MQMNLDFHPCQRPTVEIFTTEYSLENTVSLNSIHTLATAH